MKVSSIVILILLVVSCSEIQMVYEDDKSLINPLYNKSKIKIYGLDLPYLKKYTPGLKSLNSKSDYTEMF